MRLEGDGLSIECPLHSTPLLSQTPREGSGRVAWPADGRRDGGGGHFRMAKNLGPELWIFSEALSTSIAIQWTWDGRGGECCWRLSVLPDVLQDLY